VIGSPAYFAEHRTPRTPQELTRHECINLRYVASGKRYAWEFEKNRRRVNVKLYMSKKQGRNRVTACIQPR
jgi:hypothetical protein